MAGGVPLPPAYALELLTIFAWEQGCRRDAFSLAQGLRTVLGLLQHYGQLCIFWTVSYSLEDPAVAHFVQSQLQRPRYLLKPQPALLPLDLETENSSLLAQGSGGGVGKCAHLIPTV